MSTSTTSESAAKKDTSKLQRAIVDGLEDVKAQDIQVFNTEQLSPLFERVIIATGSSNRQTKALAASVRDAVRKAGFAKPRTEGEENGEWVIVDCGQVVVHVMQPAIRQYYRLEEIWGEKPVRLKLGADKPRKITASEDASAGHKAATKKPAAKRASAPKAPASKTPLAKVSSAAKATPKAAQPAKPKSKPVAKKASTNQVAAPKTPMKTVVVKSAAVKKAAPTKTVAKAVPQKAAAKKTAPKAASKTASKTASKA